MIGETNITDLIFFNEDSKTFSLFVERKNNQREVGENYSLFYFFYFLFYFYGIFENFLCIFKSLKVKCMNIIENDSNLIRDLYSIIRAITWRILISDSKEVLYMDFPYDKNIRNNNSKKYLKKKKHQKLIA